MDRRRTEGAKRRLVPVQERLGYINVDYNHGTHAPELTSLRHRPFMAGAGTTLHPDVVFLLKSPSRLDSRAGETKRGIQYRLIESLCAHAGIERFYVTYLLKYELEHDRDPRPLEAAQALTYVREEISLLAPKVIALPGERIHRLLLPEVEYAPRAHRLIQGRRGTYYALPDLMACRRTISALADLQDDVSLMAHLLHLNA